MKTAVVYWSGTGNTEAMARAVAEGMTAAGAEAVLLTPAEIAPGDLNAYKAMSADPSGIPSSTGLTLRRNASTCSGQRPI